MKIIIKKVVCGIFPYVTARSVQAEQNADIRARDISCSSNNFFYVCHGTGFEINTASVCVLESYMQALHVSVCVCVCVRIVILLIK